jgi:hypothetical protein
MNADPTNVEARLRSGFARLAEPVVPMPDPYARLLRRARRSRRRFAGLGSLLAAVLVAALLVPLLGEGAGNPYPTPTPGVDDNRGADITPWIQRLLDTPTRGSLAGDQAFILDLTGRLRLRDFQLSPELNHRTVLFAGDVGTYRAVLIAFHSETRQFGVWLVADKGSSAAKMAAATTKPGSDVSTRQVLPEDLQPYTTTAVADAATKRYLAIGLAPGGCQIATKDSTRPQSWRDEDTVDYVVRTDALGIDESTEARVTCDGVVRVQAPLANNGRVSIAPPAVTDQQVDGALAGTRGTRPDRATARNEVRSLMSEGHGAHDCRVLYAGPVPGAVSSSPVPGGVVREPPVVVTACTLDTGDTAYMVSTVDGGGEGGYSRTRLSDPRAIFAVYAVSARTSTPSGGTNGTDTSTTPSDHVLILAPATATAVQVLRGGQVTATVPLTDGVGSITLTQADSIQLRALDAAGTVVGSGTAPSGSGDDVAKVSMGPPDPVVDNWS